MYSSRFTLGCLSLGMIQQFIILSFAKRHPKMVMSKKDFTLYNLVIPKC